MARRIRRGGIASRTTRAVWRWVRHVMGPAGAALLLVGFSAPSTSTPLALDSDAVLIRLTSAAGQRTIQDSKWGFVGRLQAAINDRSSDCGIAPIEQDGFFGRATAEAARDVAQCRGARQAPNEDLTVASWQAVTGEPAPSALDRALTLARTLEGTDYDRLEWNVCVDYKADADSVLTWGPYGKTLGWGGEIMSVLKRLDRRTLTQIFAEERAQGLDQLLALQTDSELGVHGAQRYPGAKALMEKICKQPNQMAAWSRAFWRLGRLPETRAIYEDVAWGDSGWFRQVVERLEQSWRAIGLTPTEVDFAFFLDRSIHMGWGSKRFEAVDAALAALKAQTPAGELTNARARLAMADAVRAKAQEGDRLSRDSIFLADAEAELASAMDSSKTWPRDWKSMWRARAGIAASDVGLSDARPAPEFAVTPLQAAPRSAALVKYRTIE